MPHIQGTLNPPWPPLEECNVQRVGHAIIGGPVDNACTAPKKSALSSVRQAIEEAQELAKRVTKMVDDACGPVPTLGCQNKPPQISGALPTIRADAEILRSLIMRANLRLNDLASELQ